MTPAEPSPPTAVPAPRSAVRVWDLPTRLFHWVLVVLVVFSVVTAKVGGLWLDWHMRAGYAILALLLFRILWGFAGSRYARFASFVRGPRAVLDYVRGRSLHVAGHNPLGGWSVLALLAVLLMQAVSGLFTSDGSFTEGPLARLVSSAVVETLSTVHGYVERAIYALVALHVIAIIFYTVFRGQTLLGPMVRGDHPALVAPAAEDDLALRLRALLLAALSAALVGYIVTL
jgi:cytochrome b